MTRSEPRSERDVSDYVKVRTLISLRLYFCFLVAVHSFSLDQHSADQKADEGEDAQLLLRSGKSKLLLL